MNIHKFNKTIAREDIIKAKYNDNIEKLKIHVEEKTAHQKFNRYLQTQRQENENYFEIQRRSEAVALSEQKMQQDNKLADELRKLKTPEIADLKLRQLLRENSPELRELERKLKAAYVNKELAAQIAHKREKKFNDKIQEENAYQELKKTWEQEQEWRTAKFEEEIAKKTQYKRELQDQIILREKSRRQDYEEFLREKKMIDDIIQRIHDEDERELTEKMCKMEKTREEIKAFREARELWRKKKKEEIEEENRRIQEYLMVKANEISVRQAERVKRDELKEKISEEIAKQLYEQRRKQAEREEIIQELMEEETKEAMERRYKKELENKIRQRIETRESLLRQMQESAERKRQEAEENARYKENLLEELAEQAKLDQLSDQKRRMKMLQLRRDIEQIMTERRQKQAEEMQILIKLEEQEKEEAEKRRQLVEEERIRMLQDHVKNLIGYLPKGLLKSTDLPYLGDNFTPNLSNPQSD